MGKRKNKHNKNFKKDSVKNDSLVSGRSGAGGLGDKTTDYLPSDFFMDNFMTDKRIPFNGFNDKSWKNPDADPDVERGIKKEADKLNLNQVIYKALEYERKYGGSVVVIGTEELSDDPSKKITPQDIEKNGLKFLRPISRAAISVTNLEMNPLSIYYGKPVSYNIRSVEVHRSRLLVFDGGGQDDHEVSRFGFDFTEDNDCFGTSVLEPLFDDILRDVATRKAAFQLINNASIMVFKQEGDTSSLANISKEAKLNREKIKGVLNQASIFRSVMLDKGSEISNYAATFGSIPELIDIFSRTLSAASDIPSARFLGESPGGLNANGKGELANYYDSILAQQQIRLKPQLDKITPYLMMSAFGKIITGFDVQFESLYQTNESDKAEIRSKDWNNISNAFENKVGDRDWAAREAIEKGIFSNEPVIKNDDIENILSEKEE
jgi:phage-related protein (TIGR01555 family)